MARILVVDGDAPLREWCGMHLATLGHTVKAVGEPRKALEALKEQVPDLVLLSTDFQGGGAWALAAGIRSNPATAAVPILFVVPAGDDAARAQAGAIEPGDVLVKPFSHPVLADTVTARLASRKGKGGGKAEDATRGVEAWTPPPGSSALLMETKVASVLVVVLRNLVSLARSLRGRSLDALLQRFFTEAREAITAQGGWVVRMDATGVTALFENSPHELRSHASHAIEAALTVVLATRRVKRWAEASLGESSTPNLSVGCGVHSGDVVVARLSMGGQLTPSIAGQTVDVANRLNGRAKGLGWSVAVSETSALLAESRFEFRRRATLTDTDHDVTIPIVEVAGFNPASALPGELPIMAEVREALLANTVMARLAGDVDPFTADQTVVINASHLVDRMLPKLPDRRVARRLGQGEQITTFMMLHVPSDREEAVKTVPLAQVSPEFVGRYLDIYRRVGKIAQRNVVAVIEAGQTPELAYVATEWLRGPSLAELVRKRLSIGVALNQLVQMCLAVDAIHDLGMFHGALRADHFLFRDERVVVLADFNASAQVYASLAEPPAAGAARADFAAGVRADLRSLGLILLAMLTDDAALAERALAGSLTSVMEASRLPLQLSSLQPCLDGLLGVGHGKPFLRARESLAEMVAVKELWSRPVFSGG
jgi:DNA-binding response OmpR family regulator